MTGSSRGNDTTYDYATLKYDPNGTLLWVQRYSNPDSYDDANALAIDEQGNVYVTGSTATLKYDTNGTLLWERRYNDGNGYSSAIALAMDEQGNVYVTGSGSSVGTAGFGNYITLKYDTNGTLLWTQRYNGTGINGASASDITVDQQGNTYVTGTICTANNAEGWCINTDYATLKYDPQGNLQWEQRYNGPGNYSDYASALTVDKQGNVYVIPNGTKKLL